MRLIKCYVENFGILHKYECRFSEGINCHISENGTGKTTLAAFIRAMLYGLGDNRRSSLDENERRRYTPWQGGTFGGSLTFSKGGEVFTVERSFGTRQSQDTCVLRRSSDGAILPTRDKSVGEMFLDIDHDGFSSTLFISEKSIGVGASSSLSSRISDMLDTASDGVDNALRRLRDKARFYEKRGGGGEIADTRAKLSGCNSAIEAAEAHAENAEIRSRELHSISLKLRQAREQREAMIRSSGEHIGEARVNGVRSALLKERIRSESKRLDDIMGMFKAGIPSEDVLEREQAKYEKARQMKDGMADTAKRHSRIPFLLSLLLGIALLAFGLILGILRYPIAYVGCAIGAAVALCAVVLALYRGSRDAKERCRREGERERLIRECEQFLSHFNTRTSEPFSEIRRAVGEYEYTTSLIDRLSAELREIDQATRITQGGGVPSYSTERLDREIEELERAYAVTEREYRIDLARADELDELLAKRAELSADIERYSWRLYILKKAEQMLEEASMRLAASHIDGLRRSLQKYIGLMGEREEEFTVDSELRISRVVGAAARAKESFSRGLRELYTLALRLALTDTVYQGFTPFVILDDPFSALDDRRCAMAKDMLRRLGRERQIIYFTCSEGRRF